MTYYNQNLTKQYKINTNNAKTPNTNTKKIQTKKSIQSEQSKQHITKNNVISILHLNVINVHKNPKQTDYETSKEMLNDDSKMLFLH